MIEWIDPNIASALLSALLSSLWIGALVFLILRLIDFGIDSKNASVRYAINLSGLLIIFFMTIGLFAYEVIVTEPTVSGSALFDETSASKTVFFSIEALSTNVTYNKGYWVIAWLLGSFFLVSRFVWQWYNIKNLRSQNINPLPREFYDSVLKLKERLGISLPISVFQSMVSKTPMVIGYLKPVILIPAGFLTSFSPEQIEAIILHELAHIRRQDYLVNILQSLIESLLYFNPFVWLISTSIRVERERACDDYALRHGAQEQEYVRALIKVYENQLDGVSPAMAFSSKKYSTLKRIQRIMTTQNQNNNRSALAALIAPILIILILISPFFKNVSDGTLLASAGGTPDMEVAGIPLPDLSGLRADRDVSPDAARSIAEITKRSADPGLSLMDTLDPEVFKKYQREMEMSMQKLEQTEAWQEMQTLSREMAKMSTEMLEELQPLMNEEIRKSIESSKLNMKEIQEVIRETQRSMESVEFERVQKELEKVMALHEKEISSSLEAMEERLQEINLEQIETQAEIAREIAEKYRLNEKEIREMARNAELLSREAEKYAEAVAEFYDKTVDMLIDDGYIKSKDDIDDFDIENGTVKFNGKEVKSKHRQKYRDLYYQYFKDEEFHFNKN